MMSNLTSWRGLRRRARWAAVGLAAALGGAAWAQQTGAANPPQDEGASGNIAAVQDPPAPPADTRTLQEMQRDLRKLRATYFGTMRNREIRQAGIARLRVYTDPVIFPDLLEIFAHEQEDVRTAILDHLYDLKTEQADATLAWAAIHDKQEWFRNAAAERLARRTAEEGAVPMRAQWVIAAGLRKTGKELDASAELASTLKLYEAIPMLINAQLGSSRVGGAGGATGGALGEILIATQQAYVADLEPVVGDSAVAFDPQLGVITSGTYLRVTDAAVVTYRTEVHKALTRLADAGWDGRSTKSFGYDIPKWRHWYVNEFLPYRRQVEAQAAAAAPSPAAPPAQQRPK